MSVPGDQSAPGYLGTGSSLATALSAAPYCGVAARGVEPGVASPASTRPKRLRPAHTITLANRRDSPRDPRSIVFGTRFPGLAIFDLVGHFEDGTPYTFVGPEAAVNVGWLGR